MSVNIVDLLKSDCKSSLGVYWVPAKALNWTTCRTLKQKVCDCIEVWKGDSIAVNWKATPATKNNSTDSIGMTFYE